MKKSFFSFLFILAVIFAVRVDNSNAQWVQVTSGINPLMNIYSFTASGTSIFTGSDSGVYVSTNNGTNWTLTALSGKLVYSLATLGTDIYAGTTSNGVYRSTNNGTSWTQTSLTTQTVYALTVNGSSIFAGASGSGVYLSTNNGVNWTQNSLSSHTVLSLATSGANDYAGTSIYGIYRSTNSGGNWAQTSMNFSSLKALAITGSYYYAGAYSLTGSNGFYRSTDGGTWALVGLNNINVLSLAISGGDVIAGTESGVFLSANNGTNWFNKNQGFVTVPHIEALLVSNNYIYAGTYGQSVWRRTLTDIIEVRNISTEIPSEYSLSQNFPNPFNPSTGIRYAIPKDGAVKLTVYDELGREVVTLVNERQTAGTYEAVFDAANLTSGIYYYRLTTEGFSETRKMALIK
ncbi:MAG: T9SS type A sorting domain-containing protein [Bacteroidetes bacterium]|nr:T9SS type A sorting domain-containing protein [Bacteroidota bacterium]